MKFKVIYYDCDTDKQITKDCHSMEFRDGNFSFYPIDNLVDICKVVIIDHPKVTIRQYRDKLSISVDGYQYRKEGVSFACLARRFISSIATCFDATDPSRSIEGVSFPLFV